MALLKNIYNSTVILVQIYSTPMSNVIREADKEDFTRNPKCPHCEMKLHMTGNEREEEEEFDLP